jgi:hypothetical protein
MTDLANSPYLDLPVRRIEDARLSAAASLLPIAKALGELAKAQKDTIPAWERDRGTPMGSLYGLLLDLHYACDNLVSDIPELRAQMNEEG